MQSRLPDTLIRRILAIAIAAQLAGLAAGPALPGSPGQPEVLHVWAGHGFPPCRFGHELRPPGVDRGHDLRQVQPIQRNGIARSMACGATEAAARRCRLRFFYLERAFPPGSWLVPPLQGREHAVQEELALGRIKVEPVLATQRLGVVKKRVSGSTPRTCGRRRPPAR